MVKVAIFLCIHYTGLKAGSETWGGGGEGKAVKSIGLF